MRWETLFRLALVLAGCAGGALLGCGAGARPPERAYAATVEPGLPHFELLVLHLDEVCALVEGAAPGEEAAAVRVYLQGLGPHLARLGLVVAYLDGRLASDVVPAYGRRMAAVNARLDRSLDALATEAARVEVATLLHQWLVRGRLPR